jgi:hypothetical protein
MWEGGGGNVVVVVLIENGDDDCVDDGGYSQPYLTHAGFCTQLRHMLPHMAPCTSMVTWTLTTLSDTCMLLYTIETHVASYGTMDLYGDMDTHNLI